MPVLRTDIEKALDELISNEEGMRFQGLAVVLAKQKWPNFIASERKKDLGFDAHAPALLAQDGKGRALACSLTATLEKIRNDIEKIRSEANDLKMGEMGGDGVKSLQAVEKLTVSKKLIRVFSLYGNMPLN
jgi:hypothetical protein